jgi:acetyltransferase-like isoleucine patch superfamily enzyme
MKKLVFSSLWCLVMLVHYDAQGQYYWNGTGTVHTYTTDNVGIGLGPVTDSRFHINNSLTGDAATGPYNISEILLTRDFYGSDQIAQTAVLSNFFEIWNTDYTGTPHNYVAGTPTRLFEINHQGWVGINLPCGNYSCAVYPLDVYGHIHTSQNAFIDNDANIGHDANISHNAVVTNDANISHNANITNDANISHNASITNDATIGHNLGVNNNETIHGDIFMSRTTNDNTMRHIDAVTTAGAIGLHANTTNTNGPAIELFGNSTDPNPGQIQFTANGTAANTIGFNFLTYGTDADLPTCTTSPCAVSRMRIYKNGKVAIGSMGMNVATSYGYKLYVEDGILTERVKVALTTTGEWADFVFNKNYHLKPLAEVKTYIQENKHLPEVPSAEDIVKDGIDLAKMDAKLLQKIEELTLYIIDQQKEIDDLKKELKK